MPYKTIADLPATIKKLPVPAQRLFLAAFNASAKKKNSDETSFKIAWAVVKKRFKKSENGDWVARAGAFVTTKYYTFQAQPAEKFISRTEDGNTIHNYVLTDIMPDNKGTAPTEELMNKWAAWINNEQPAVDTDHELWDAAIKAHAGNNKMVARAMKFKKGIAKAIKAVVDKGRLIVSLLFDKRYNKYVEKVKGLSIEAGVTTDEATGKWRSGDLFGFTLAMNTKPVNPRAVRVGA